MNPQTCNQELVEDTKRKLLRDSCKELDAPSTIAALIKTRTPYRYPHHLGTVEHGEGLV